jgi:hypothetical protein
VEQEQQVRLAPLEQRVRRVDLLAKQAKQDPLADL